MRLRIFSVGMSWLHGMRYHQHIGSVYPQLWVTVLDFWLFLIIKPMTSYRSCTSGRSARAANHSLAGNYIGTAVANLVGLFNPGIVVVGGLVAQTGDVLLEPVRQGVYQRSYSASNHVVRITKECWGSVLRHGGSHSSLDHSITTHCNS
jgi:hypothetical protein